LAAIYLLAPVMLRSSSDAGLPGNRDAGGWSVLIYPFFYVYGFVVVSDTGLEARIREGRRWSLALALLLSTVLTLLWLRGGEPAHAAAQFAPFEALYGLSAWCWLLALWGYVTRYLTTDTSVLRYVNDAILPFYILHQTVLVAVSYYVVQWRLADGLKLLWCARLRDHPRHLSLPHSPLQPDPQALWPTSPQALATSYLPLPVKGPAIVSTLGFA
jgi:hypothetical protein